MTVKLNGVTYVDNIEDGSIQDVNILTGPLTNLLEYESGSVDSIGNNTLVTPASGNKLRVSYLSYNPSLAAEIAFRFGATGTLFLRNNLKTGGSVIAKDFGDFRYIEGFVDEPLILNLSAAVPTIWNAFYVEIPA